MRQSGTARAMVFWRLVPGLLPLFHGGSHGVAAGGFAADLLPSRLPHQQNSPEP